MASLLCRRGLLNYKTLFHTPYRTKYIILLPETAEALPEHEELSMSGRPPEFNNLSIEKCDKIMRLQVESFQTKIWQLQEHLTEQLENKNKVDIFKDVIEPLETYNVPFDNTWGAIKTLYMANQNIVPPDVYMNFHKEACLAKATRFNCPQIFKVCKEALENDFQNFNREEKRIVQKYVLEGTLNGLAVASSNKNRLNYNIHKTIAHQRQMEKKLDAHALLFKHVINDPEITKDFPLDLLKKLAADPAEPTKGPWIVRIKPHIYSHFMEYCPDADIRFAIYENYVRQGSTVMDDQFCVFKDVQEIRLGRYRQAKALEMNSYFEMSLKTKMAGSLENINETLSKLLDYGRPAQEAEIHELELFAFDNGFSGNIQLWDLDYWKRRQQLSQFDYDKEAIRSYFPLPQVLLGLFTLCEQLFGIEINEDKTVKNAWHPSVTFYKVSDKKTNSYLGGFYVDPYARPGKVQAQSRGWMVGMHHKSDFCNSLPIASLIFNLNEPTEEKPCLLNFEEVRNLFNKFGNVLQHLLTTSKCSDVSGLTNIEWDAAETCSFFLEFWASERGTLESISGHYETGEPLPSHLLENLTHLHQHLAGFNLCREIYMSNLDIELHLGLDHWSDIMKRLWPQHFLFDLYYKDVHPCSFREVLCYDWGGAYYSHLWAKMLAADVFMAFAEVGFENQQAMLALGNKFRSTFLSLGGSCHASEVFGLFRDRDPSVEPLIHLLGLKKYESTTESDTKPELIT